MYVDFCQFRGKLRLAGWMDVGAMALIEAQAENNTVHIVQYMKRIRVAWEKAFLLQL